LANGLWLGTVPSELSSLNFVEWLLVAWVCLNSYFVRVAVSGFRKMTSHVIAFESPIPKVYQCLPPPIEDVQDVLAILFTRSCSPTENEYKHVPLLVHSFIVCVLEWLKLNNIYYKDLEIAHDELVKYPEGVPPVTVKHQCSLTTKVEEGTSSFDNSEGEGVEDGECPFIVHGLMSEQYEIMSVEALF
jgi:hypothetical protein